MSSFFWKKTIEDNLDEFNRRKDLFKMNGLDSFISSMESEYPHFYNRFYSKFQKDALASRKFFMLLVKPIPHDKTESQVRSYCDFIAADYFFSEFHQT